MGNIADGDHGVPVLFQVAHLVLSGNIGGRKDPHHTGQCLGRFGIDGKDSGSGMGRTDGGGVDHALHVHVVGILAVAQDLFPDVDAFHRLADGPVGLFLRNHTAALDLGSQQHGLEDLHIARTAADVVFDGLFAVFFRGIGVLIQQGLGAQDHAGNAEAALDRTCRAVGVGIELLFKFRQAFHGDDGFSFQFVGLLNTGADRFAVHQHGAGAAGTFAAAVLDGCESQFVPEVTHEPGILRYGDGFAVDGECCHR